MANTITQKAGTAAPTGGMIKSELAIRHRAAAHTTANSSMLYIGEDKDDDGVTIRALGFGIYGNDDASQSGITIGGNLTFATSVGLTAGVSGSTVTHTLNLNQLGHSTTNGHGDKFLVQDTSDSTYYNLAKGSINISGFNNDAGYTTNGGDITGVTAGTGLSGGGTSGGVTLATDLSELSDGTSDINSDDEVIYLDNGTNKRKAFSELKLSEFNNDSSWTSNTGTTTASNAQTFTNKGGNISQWTNDSGYTTNSGDITGVTAGTGLSGGGTSGGVTLATDLSELSDGTSDIDSNDEVIYLDNGTNKRKAFSELKLSEFNNDSSWTSNSGDITGVTAGTGLSGGGTSGGVTLNVEASQTQITAVGTIGTGTWQGDAIASAYLDSDTAHLSGAQTFSGAKTFTSIMTLEAHPQFGEVTDAALVLTAGDMVLDHDLAQIYFGADQDVSLTHIADTGLRIRRHSGDGSYLHLHDGNESVGSAGSRLILTSNGVAFSMPTADGTSGYQLTTDGSGTLSWASSGSVADNSIGADELNVADDGSSGQVLTSDGDGSFSWTAKTTNTDVQWSGTSTGLTASTGRTSLGLVIGTNVQAWDAQLDTLAGASATNATAVTNLTGTNSGDTSITDSTSTTSSSTRGSATGVKAAYDRGSTGVTNAATAQSTANAAMPKTGGTFTGDITMNSTEQLRFGDTGTYIYQSTDGQLDIDADDEVEINADNVDINATVNISGDTALGGDLEVDTIANSSGAILIDSANSVILDAHTGIINFKDQGTEFFRIEESSNTTILQNKVNGGDIIIRQYDGNTNFRVGDDNWVSIGGNTAAQGRLRFYEDSDNGSNYVGLQAAATLSEDTTYTLPTADGSNGQVLSTDGSGALSWTTKTTNTDVQWSGTSTGLTASTGRSSLGLGTGAVLDTAAIADGGTGLATADQIHTFVTGFGYLTADVSVADGGTGSSTASGARSNLGVDAAGTDNSTNVTLASVSGNYLSLSGQAITAGTVPLTLGGTGATSAGAARTALGVDAAGTDNSTNVSLGGSLDYITISGQTITRNAIDLAADVSGVLPSANLDSDTAHLSGTQTFSGTKTFSNTITGSVSGNAATVTTNANLTGDVTSSGNATTIATDAVDIAMLSASGTAGSSTFLRGDNTWATPTASVSNNSIGADELNVADDGSSGEFLRSDGDGSFTWATPTDTNTQLSSENVQDIAGAMFTGNTETGITATYQDSDGTIDLTIGTLNQDTTGNAATATLASTVTLADESSDTTCFPTFVTTATGTRALKSDSSRLTYNANTGTLSATDFSGQLSMGSHTVNDIDVGSEFVDSDEHIMTSGAIKEKIEDYSYITGSSSDTLTNKTWNGNAIASAYLDSDTAHLSGTQTFSGAKTFSSEVTFGSGFDVGSDAAGDMLYHNGTTYQRLAVGSENQVLTLTSTLGVIHPNWESASSGGSGTVNSGTDTAFAHYAATGTTISDTITSSASITADIDGNLPELILSRVDASISGTNGLGRYEITNSSWSSDRSNPNFQIQAQSGGVEQAANEGGCAVLFKTVATRASDITSALTTRIKINETGHVAIPKRTYESYFMGDPAQTRTVQLDDGVMNYNVSAENGGIIDIQLPDDADARVGQTWTIAWECRHWFSAGGGYPTIIKITQPSGESGVIGYGTNSTGSSLYTVKTNSSSNWYRGIGKIVCVDDGSGVWGAPYFFVEMGEQAA